MDMKKRVLLLAAATACLLLPAWAVWGNTALERNTYTVWSDTLPDSFDGWRIAHISDLHNAEMGEDNQTLLEAIKDAAPDMIAITGDLIDSRHTDVEIALRFAERAVKIAPCYYVTGNHEARTPEYQTLKAGLTELDVVVLENQRVELERSGEQIVLLGVDDPSFRTDYLLGDSALVIKSALQEQSVGEDAYTVLLSHRPELFDVYTGSGVDLVLSGHAHGGQFRLPFVGGLAAPNQGLFPKYDGGLYTEDGTNMIVSRGIGNSVIPIRLNNRPEVVIVELKKQA